jgi:hypothetical protein
MLGLGFEVSAFGMRRRGKGILTANFFPQFGCWEQGECGFFNPYYNLFWLQIEVLWRDSRIHVLIKTTSKAQVSEHSKV